MFQTTKQELSYLILRYIHDTPGQVNIEPAGTKVVTLW